MFGREPQLPVDGLNPQFQSLSKYSTDFKKRLQGALKTARQVQDRVSARYAEYYDSKAQAAVLEVGDLVLVKNVGLIGEKENKLADKYFDNPYLIVAKPNPDVPVYKVEEVDGTRKRVVRRNLLLPIGSISN